MFVGGSLCRSGATSVFVWNVKEQVQVRTVTLLCEAAGGCTISARQITEASACFYASDDSHLPLRHFTSAAGSMRRACDNDQFSVRRSPRLTLLLGAAPAVGRHPILTR